MTILFGWENRVLTGVIAASAEVTGLGAGQLQNPQGATSTAWQTPSGVTAASLTLDGGVGAIWRVLSLHRTNLTMGATVRWRIGPDEALVERTPDLTARLRPGWTPPAGWTFTRSGTAWGFDAAGLMVSYAGNVPRWAYDSAGTPLGILLEAARTNRALRSRDLASATWVKANATATLTATGLDGATNSASVITATVANGTATQALVLASLQRTFSVYLRRRTGTGPVDITTDGGATWTPVAITPDWQRVSVTQTLANPTIGLRLQTAGDAVDVDVAQLEDAAQASSPIVTTTAAVTRNADDVTITSSAVASSGTLYAETTALAAVLSVRARDAGGTNLVVLRSGASSGALADLQVTQGGATVYDGPDTAHGPTARQVTTWTAGGAAAWLNGAANGAYAGAIAPMERLQVTPTGIGGVLSELRLYAVPLTAGQALALSASASTLDATALTLDTGVVPASIVAGIGQAVTVLGADVAGRWLRCDLGDSANPEGALRVAQMFAGPARSPARTLSTRASAFARRADLAVPVTRGGQEYTELRFARRAWRVTLPLLSAAEVWSLVHALQAAAEDGRNILLVPMPSSGRVNAEALFGRLAEAGEVPWAEGAQTLRAWSATITERL